MFGCLHLTAATPDGESLLLDLAESFSPRIEHSSPGVFLIDLTSSHLPRHWIPPLSNLRFNLATTPDLAYLATLTTLPEVPTLLTPADFDEVPLSFLTCCSNPTWRSCLPLLHLWGLGACGEFTRLPRRELTHHAGPHAAELHQVLCGETCRSLCLIRPLESFVSRVCLESPIASLEGLMFQANSLLQTLSVRLQASHLGASVLHIGLTLESGDASGRTIRLAEPRNHLPTLQRILHSGIEHWQVPAPVTDLEIRIEPTRLASSQREWLGRSLSHPQRWPETLTALQTLLGDDRVGIPLPPADHRPDALRLQPISEVTPAPALAADIPSVVCPPQAAALPLRRFRPPLPVAVAGEGHGLGFRPLALLGGPHPGPIRHSLGPFPLSGHWWDDSARWRRIEWDIELESRHLLRLALLPPDRWQLEGRY